jgi:hypothetical protein
MKRAAIAFTAILVFGDLGGRLAFRVAANEQVDLIARLTAADLAKLAVRDASVHQDPASKALTRPGFSIRRVGCDCALEVRCRFAYRLSGNQDPREQFPRLEVVGAFRQQAFEIRARLLRSRLPERVRARDV